MIQQTSEDLLWSQIVARAWCDGDFKHRLVSNPRNVLIEYGMDLPEGIVIQVVEGEEVMVEDLDQVRRFTFTEVPPDDLMEEDLAGGAVAYCWCAACGRCGACGCRCSCRCSCRCF